MSAGFMRAMENMEPSELGRVISVAAGLLAARANEGKPHTSTMRELGHWFCLDHGITTEDLRGRDQIREISLLRQRFMYEAYLTHEKSLGDIGRYLGKRDHSSIAYGIRAHKKRAGL